MKILKYYVLFLFFTFFILSLNAQTFKKDLVAYWSFDDCTANDQSGNGYHGTMKNDPTFVTGVFNRGKAIHFWGINDYIAVNDKPDTEIGSFVLLPYIDFYSLGEFTISMWVFEKGYSIEYGNGYIFFGNHNNGWLGINEHIQQKPKMDPYVRYNEFSVGSTLFDETAPDIDPFTLPYDFKWRHRWQHYVMTYQNGEIKAYRNSQLVGSLKQKIKITEKTAGLNRHWWYLGEEYRTCARFTGAMDEVMIFKKALTQTEIDTLYSDQTCSQGGFFYQFNSEKEFDNFNTVKDAKIISSYDNFIQLTSSEMRQAGAVWHKEPVCLKNGFDIDFVFTINNGNQGTCGNDGSRPGADGLAFVIQNTANNIIGYTDWGLGYQNISNGIAVEFDMYCNKTQKDSQGNPVKINDPNGNHIAVQYNKSKIISSVHTPDNTLAINKNIIDIEPNGPKYYARIRYDRKNLRFQVFFGNSPEFTTPVIDIPDFNIYKYIELQNGDYAYIGFTAGTGDAWEEHNIRQFKFCPASSCDTIIPSLKLTEINCYTDTFGLSVNNEYDIYKWFKKGTTNPIDSGKSTIVVKEEGEYWVEVVSKEGCRGLSQVLSVKKSSDEDSFIVEDYSISKPLTYEKSYYTLKQFKPIRIKNISKKSIIISKAIMSKNTSFSIPASQLPFELKPNESKELQICFSPFILGSNYDTLQLTDACSDKYVALEGICGENEYLGESNCGMDIQMQTQTLPYNGFLFTSLPSPNPAAEFIKINFINSNIEKDRFLAAGLYNIFGEKIAEAELKTDNILINNNIINESGQIIFNTKNISNGSYFVIIRNNSNNIMYKVVINK